ncbi:MAG TPA: GFA family protein [Povalibacter sp.]|uniref:GFA family protein n=1 Tax=Povalibacter sp. TaxID=1962978 RepID=UPI002C588B06|nr:GFA family protein [Povalibacter sp.]HMN44921.1 GFA family protein [Povalibacter sp.]
MNDAKVEGGCLCGAVRYRVCGPLLSSSICHCPTCRRASGAPAVAWFVVRLDHFELLRGDLTTFASSAPVIRQFCGRCGSQIVYRNDDAPALIELTTATLDDPEVFPPTREIWLSHRIAWEAVDPQREQDPEESHA